MCLTLKSRLILISMACVIIVASFAFSTSMAVPRVIPHSEMSNRDVPSPHAAFISGNQTLGSYTDDLNWAGFEFSEEAYGQFTSVSADVNVEPVKVPTNPDYNTCQAMSAWISLEDGMGGASSLIQFGYAISPNSAFEVPLNQQDTQNATVQPNNAYIWWEYLSLNGQSQYTIPYNVGVPDANGGAATVPVGSTLHLGLETNANSDGNFNQVFFSWSDYNTGQYYSEYVNLPTTVSTMESAFIVEAPSIGSYFAQIPQFDTVEFYNIQFGAIEAGNYVSYGPNTLFASGQWEQDYMIQQSTWWASPNPFAEKNILNSHYSSIPSYPYSHDSGYMVETWQTSDYNLC